MMSDFTKNRIFSIKLAFDRETNASVLNIGFIFLISQLAKRVKFLWTHPVRISTTDCKSIFRLTSPACPEKSKSNKISPSFLRLFLQTLSVMPLSASWTTNIKKKKVHKFQDYFFHLHFFHFRFWPCYISFTLNKLTNISVT